MLGLWAAELKGLSGDEAAAYAKEVVWADFEEPGEEDVVRKVMADFKARGIAVSEDELRKKMKTLADEARKQLIQD